MASTGGIVKGMCRGLFLIAGGVLLLLTRAACPALGDGVDSGPGSALATATVRPYLDSVFGPIRARAQLVREVQALPLAEELIDSKAVLTAREPTASGVRYTLRTGEGPMDGVLLTIGVFESQQAALASFDRSAASISALPPPLPGVGDRAFVSPQTFLLVSNNVVVAMTWGGDAARTREILQAVAEELEAGTRFVTRGASVVLPQVRVSGVPATLASGIVAACPLTVANADASQLAFGIDWGPQAPQTGVTLHREPLELALDGSRLSREPGPLRFTLVAATPANVIAAVPVVLQIGSGEQ